MTFLKFCFSYVLVMERPERHIDLFDYLNKAGPIKEPVVRDVFIQVRKNTLTLHHATPKLQVQPSLKILKIGS